MRTHAAIPDEQMVEIHKIQLLLRLLPCTAENEGWSEQVYFNFAARRLNRNSQSCDGLEDYVSTLYYGTGRCIQVSGTTLDIIKFVLLSFAILYHLRSFIVSNFCLQIALQAPSSCQKSWNPAVYR